MIAKKTGGPMKKIYYTTLLFALFFTILFVDSAQARRKRRLSKTSDKEVLAILNKNLNFTKITLHKIDNKRYFTYIENSKTNNPENVPNKEGYIFLTGDYAPLNGFSGPTSCALVYDQAIEKIKKIFIVESKDSPDYVKRFFLKGMMADENGFFNQFKDYPQKLHTVTGATVTSRNIIKSFKKTLEKIEPIVRKIKKQSPAAKKVKE